jgi:hypothetical protein
MHAALAKGHLDRLPAGAVDRVLPTLVSPRVTHVRDQAASRVEDSTDFRSRVRRPARPAAPLNAASV